MHFQLNLVWCGCDTTLVQMLYTYLLVKEFNLSSSKDTETLIGLD